MPLTKSLDTSLQTLGIFAAVNKFVIANQDVTNSSTLTDSTDLQVSLITGATYDFETLELVGGSNVNAAGTTTKLAFTGSGTFYGTPRRGHANNAEPINVSPSWPGSGTAVDAQIGWPGGGSGQSTIVSRVGRIVTTSAGTLKTQFAQSTATSGHYARLYAGSFLKVQRVS
jgi:hypothetical protein